MSITSKMYKALFEELNSNNYAEKNSIYRKYTCQCGEGILYSVSVGEKVRELSIPISTRSMKFPELKGIELSLVNLPEYSSSNQVYLQLRQKEDAESYIYEILVEDIRSYLSNVQNSKDFSSSTQKILKKWKEFFSSNKDIILSESKAQGLYGELLFLKELIEHKSPGVVDSWVGVSNATHDFYVGQNAFEIKTTSTQEPYEAHINNAYQLDNNDVNGKLYMRFYAFRRDSIGGRKLPELISIIRKQLKNDIFCLETFNRKIEQAGYIDAASPYYITGYTLREAYTFEVEEDFPKIHRNLIPKGVTNLKYNLSISNCLDFAIDDKDISIIIKG